MASYIYDSTDAYPFSSVDRGFTYTPATSTEDFGAVNISATSQESYDTITVVQGNDTPFGFSTVNGSAIYYKPKRYRYSSSTDNLYTSEDYGDIVLIERYGTITDVTSSESYGVIDTQSTTSEDWGLLSGVVDISEDKGLVSSVTEDWGLLPGTAEDYEFINTTATSTEDFGVVNVAATSQESYGTVTITNEDLGVVTTFTATTPDSSEDYGTLTAGDGITEREDRYLIITNQSSLAMELGYTTSASGATYSFTANIPDNTQLFSISGALISKVVFTWVGSGNPFEIGGSADEIILAFSTVGTSGPLRLEGTSSEVFAKSYSLDAVVPFDILDYGFVLTSPTLDVDFGLVSQAYFGGEKDFGLITDTQEVTPYGLYESEGVVTESFAKGLYTGQGTISLSGEVVLPLAVTITGVGSILSTGFSIEKNTESYVGTGSLFSTSGAAEVFDANPLESTQAFITSGTATEKNTERYIGNAIVTKNITPDSFEVNTGSFVNVAVFNSGTGTGTTGGFNVGRHLKFGTTGTTGARRFNLIPLDVSGFSTISITGIKGNNANGGEEPDSGEDLQLQYSVNGGSTFILIGAIIAENDTSFNVLNTANISLPAGAKTSSTIFRILQPSTSGVTFDHYGVTEIQLSSAVVGNIVLSGGYTNLKFTSGAGETTQLFALSGSGVEKNTEDYVGTGSASISVVSVEKNTETYVAELADVTDLFASYGDLTAVTESEDYGLITQLATNVDYRYLTSDYYDITGAAVEKFVAQTPEDFSLFTFSGAAVEKFVAQTPEDFSLFQFTGAAVEKNTEDYVASGTFSTFSGAAESVTYRYSFDSFVPFFEFDYGSVSQAPTNEINLGSVSAPNTGGEQDYGIITYNDTILPYGLWQTSGSALDAFSKNIVDNGGSIILSGAIVLPLAVSIIGQGGFTVDITSIEKNTEDYVASGSLFSTSGAAEVFGANPLESTQAFITSGTAVEKFRANPPEDFALYTFSGVAIEKFTSGGGESTQLFILSGAAVEKNTEDYVGIGITTASGGGIEKNTESYTVSQASIYVLSDYGDIRESAGSTENLGLITSTATEFESFGGLARDYLKIFGYAVEKLVAKTPENTQIFATSGAGVEKFVANTPEQTVTFTYTGNVVEKNTESYVGTGQATIDVFSEIKRTSPSYQGFGFAFTANGSAEAFGANPLENTQLFIFSGAALSKTNPKWIGSGTISVDVTSIEKNTESYVGTGSLFSIVDGSEARTYVYDETTSVLFLELDYGSLTQPVDTINDFGQITNFFNEVDYGTVVYIDSVYPFGSAFFGGSALEAFSPQTPENTQVFVISGAAVEKFTSGAGESTQLFSLSGAAVEKNTEDYVGTGVTTFSGVKVEKNTEVYIGTGSASFAGSAVEKFRANPPEDFALYTFSGAAVEKFTSGAGESTQLFILSGVVVEKNTESYVGTGNAFTFIDSEEARTYDYISEIGVYTTEVSGDISSAVDTTEDYGLIISGVTTTENWGSCLPDVIKLKGGLVESFTEGVYDASGSITISGTGKVREIPRWVGGGTITISGTGTVPLTLIIVGTGNLFTASGAAESVGANPPEDFALFNVTGAAAVRITPRWFGSGTANIDVTHTMRFVPNWNGFGTISIDATSTEKNTESYVGTGNAFTFIDSDERVTFDYTSEIPEILHEYRNLINQTTVSTEDYGLISVAANEFDDFGVTERSYIKIIPTSNVRATPRQTGSGTISIDVTHVMRFVPNWNGFGTISIDATSIERNTESYVGLGQVNLTGDAGEDLVKVFVGDDGQGRSILLEGTGARITIRKYEDTVNYVLSGGSVEKFTSGAGESTQLFSLSGDAVQKNTESYAGIGTLFGIGGGAEARVYDYGSDVVIGFNEVDYGFITETPTIDIDYSTITIGEIGGIIDYGQIRFNETITSATGLIDISGAVYVTTSPAYYGAGTLTVSDTALESNTEVYTGTGFISTFAGAAEVFGVNPPENTQFFIFSGAGNTREIAVYTASASGTTTLNGASVEKNTEDYVGVGTTTIDVSHVEKNTETFVGFVTETLSGVGLCVNAKVYTGNGIVSSPSGAAEAFGAHPPENTQLFVYAGAATEKNTEDYVGLGTTTLSGTKVEKNTEVFIGAGTSTLSGAGVEKNTEVYIGTGSTSLSGVAETRLLYLYRFETDGFGTFVFLSQAATKVSVRNYKVIPESIDISITSIEKNTETFSGIGELFGFNGAAESRTINPEEDTVLYTFVGAAVAKNTEKWVGTGTTTLSGTKVEKNTESYVGTGSSALTGVGVEKNTEAYNGTGNLFTASGAAESIGSNPSESIRLFVYSGAAVERNTESYVGTGTEILTGTAVESNTESYVGTGVLNALSGAAEAYSAQTPENTVGFTFTGAGTERFIAQTPERTVLFKFTGFSVERNTEAHFGTGTATISGTAVEKNTEAYNGAGTLTASGVGLEVFSPVYVGSGGFINYSGSAESFGVNPLEDISLFRVFGFATERNTEAHFATGGATVTGVAVEKNTESYVGVGQLFSYSGAAESITVNPEEDTVLFTFVGFAAESFSAQTPENTQLFEITGFSIERNTEAYDGNGTLTASGDAYAPLFKAYSGSGSVFAINGAAESFGVNLPEDTVLYNFVGAATERNTEVYYGEEVIFIDVDSIESASRFYNGFGSFSTLSGGAESFGANPLENTQLFTYTGSAVEKNTESYIGVGNIDIDVFVIEKNIESYIGSGTSTISGFVDISQTNIVVASGSLFATSGAAEVFGVNLPESVILFTYNGTATEKNTEVFEGFVTIEITDSAIERNTESFEGSGTSNLSGISDSSATNTYIGEISLEFSGTGREEFVPGSYRGKGTATISGSSAESITEVFTASGSLFGFGGSAEASTNVADSNILATISGSAITTRTNIVLGNGTLFAFNGSANSISRIPDTEISIFVISGSSTTVNNPYKPPRTYVSVI